MEVRQAVLDIDVLTKAERRIWLRIGRHDGGLKEVHHIDLQNPLGNILKKRMLDDVQQLRVVERACYSNLVTWAFTLPQLVERQQMVEHG